jgi:NTE family protein
MDQDVWLCLSGGNALGAYQAGAYEALHALGLAPTKIAGASIGAINGALIAGNAEDKRVERLADFWRRAAEPEDIFSWRPDTNRAIALWRTLTRGRPGLFSARAPWLLSGLSSGPSLFDASTLPATLDSLIDFERLKTASPRLIVTALDAENGDEVRFDAARDRMTSEHLRAAAAFPAAFQPVEIGDQLLMDAGLQANLPLLSLFEDLPERDTLCVALDLYPAEGPRPRTLGETVARAQDLAFASQSRWAMRLLKERLAKAALLHRIRFARLTYRGEPDAAAKSFDYSRPSLERRWTLGRRDVENIRDRLLSPPREEGPGVFELDMTG